jgi:threonine dehydrogenase-like Zn-dependent dehydrogenase
MTFEQAAALPQAGQLAVQALFASGPLRPGQTVLINGAGGGVGTIGVQIAKSQGAEVTGVDSAAKLEMMRTIGFDHVIDYEKEDFTRNGRRYESLASRVPALVESRRDVCHRRRRRDEKTVRCSVRWLGDPVDHGQESAAHWVQAEQGPAVPRRSF